MISIEVKCNILRLKGSFYIKFFNKIKIAFKFRIKNGYVYIYHKNKERKEKLTNQNVNIMFFLTLIGQFYFRQQLLNLQFNSNFGYALDSSATATMSGYLIVLSKSVLSKIKNNKKSAHIFVQVDPKYNQDIFNVKVKTTMRMSVVDIIYALIYTQISMWNRKLKGAKS
ncbi:MAG: hypothetical protein E7351_02005 [Clostridiales bacterium]|nr:hypothetical protein [Clostridiales bacterium]